MKASQLINQYRAQRTTLERLNISSSRRGVFETTKSDLAENTHDIKRRRLGYGLRARLEAELRYC